MNALAAQPPAKMPRPERQKYMAFTSVVRVLAAGESHAIDRLIPADHRLADERSEVIRRLMQYGAATRAGDVVSGVIKRAGRLLRNEAEFCEVGAFDASHAADMQIALDDDPDVLKRAQALARAHGVLEVEALVHRLGLSKSHLYNLLAYAELTDEARVALTANGLSWRYAYGMRHCPPDRQPDVVTYFAEHNIPVNESARAGLIDSILSTFGAQVVADEAPEGFDPNAAADDSLQPIVIAAARVGMNRRSVYDMIYNRELEVSRNAEGIKVVQVSAVARLRNEAQAATAARAQAKLIERQIAAQRVVEVTQQDESVSEEELLETSVKLSMATLKAVEILTARIEAQQKVIDYLASELGYKVDA